MFGIFCASMGVWVFFFVKETKGRSLEDMDVLFGVVDAEKRAEDVERVLNSKGVLEEGEGDKGTAVRLEDVGATTTK